MEAGEVSAALAAMAAYPKARAHLLAQLGIPSAILTDPNFRASRAAVQP